MSVVILEDRALVRMSGADAESLLQGLITCNLDTLEACHAAWGALLTPQGKILMDFLVARHENAFLIDLDAGQRDAFVKKMTLYRLRSDVTIEPLDDAVALTFEDVEGAIRDPRADGLGWRFYGQAHGDPDEAVREIQTARHIDAVVPQGGIDFAYGDCFPHDINMDDLGGVDFAKGCYVGQEVVSRMKHRGTARKRTIRVVGSGPLPQGGASIVAAGKTIGSLGSVGGNRGLAMLRLDRVAEAKAQGEPILVDDVALEIELPDYASFSLPRVEE